MANKQLIVTWVKSAIGFEKSQKATIEGLGLKKLNQSVAHNDTPQIRGMIYKVRHLVKVEEVEA
jgi:large subunit ribosomal protein L30